MPIELVCIICLAVLFFLCIKVRANEFVSLIIAAAVMGILSGTSGTDTVAAIVKGSGDTFADIGIVIIFGVMLGNYLDAAKATNRMALDTVRLMGKKRSGLAMAITGYIVSIPVFSDAGFVILTPLVKALHRKTRVPLAILAVSLSAGLLATHVYVPPTPGPLAAAKTHHPRQDLPHLLGLGLSEGLTQDFGLISSALARRAGRFARVRDGESNLCRIGLAEQLLCQ